MQADFSKSRIAVLGAGKMGGILVKALLEKHQLLPERVRATVGHESRAHELSHKLGVSVTTDNVAAVDGADVILVCVKPQVVQELMEQIADKVTAKQLVISVAASVHTSQIETALGAGVPVIRAMPNTPCVLGQGMTALCKGQYAEIEHVDAASALFNVVGRTVVVDEKHMDAVTGLSASGPAYIYIILESLAEAGVKVGLPRDIATLLAAQTTLGAATVVLTPRQCHSERSRAPAVLCEHDEDLLSEMPREVSATAQLVFFKELHSPLMLLCRSPRRKSS